MIRSHPVKLIPVHGDGGAIRNSSSLRNLRDSGVLAVERWWVRTGDCGLRASKTARPMFVSVAKLGGSVPPRFAYFGVPATRPTDWMTNR